MRIMYLNPKKVAKYFGKRPELGKVIPWLSVKKVTVGVRWSLPKKDYVPDDNVLVRPSVALQCVGRGKWKVIVEDQYRQRVENWLQETCGG